MMSELTLQTLAKRVEELERKLVHQDVSLVKGWRHAAGLFTGSETSQHIDEEAKKIREADRAAARLEFGE
jgi:hypothetical protein